jgi:hypothetical protein
LTIVANDLEAAVPRQIGVSAKPQDKLIIDLDKILSFFP